MGKPHDEIEAMSRLKGKNAEEAWSKMLTVLEELGVELPSEGADEEEF